jgi:hypothetical protein
MADDNADEAPVVVSIEEAFSSLISDLYNFNVMMWVGIAQILAKRSVTSSPELAKMAYLCAEKAEEMKPDHPLGRYRLDSRIFRALAEILSNPDKPQPPWTPEIIVGGKKEDDSPKG